jgi:hypothetical protein
VPTPPRMLPAERKSQNDRMRAKLKEIREEE